MNFRRSIDEIAETLENAKTRGRGCTLLIGAGCSVKAGIPTANGFVEVIKIRYRHAYNRAQEKTYPKCMAELHLSERRDLIAEYVDKAKINWAHVCIALLMQAGYVDRVLTTNFDLLVVRTCALLGEFPATYDFAASQLLKAADIPEKAVFYLHGQRTGFVLMNTEEEFGKHSGLLAPVFEDAGRGRVWVVAGYSGENDPVFDHLAKVTRFDNGLYWIGYQDSEPAKHVQEKLLAQGKDAFYTNGFDADSFFVVLTQKLGIFPPDFVARPFSYLDGTLEMLTPYSLPGQTSEQDVTRTAREWIKGAIDQFEKSAPAKTVARPSKPSRARRPIEALVMKAQRLLMAGKYDEVIALKKAFERTPSRELADSLSWATVMQGNALTDQAETKTGKEADLLFQKAGEKYQAALKIKPDMHDALYNWGNALSEQAKTKTGEEADSLFKQAGEKYHAALAIKPDKHEALNNWGSALSEQAKTKTGEEADRLFKQAGEKYHAALAIKPDKHDALYNWGNALSEQAKTKTGEEADSLFKQAGEKYHAALAIKPDKHEALNNWGNALLEQAKTKTGEEADSLFKQATEKLLRAESISTGGGAYNLGCINALLAKRVQCREWLEKSQQYGTLPSRQHLMNDPDLESVRDSEWFQSFIEKLKR